MPKSALTVDLVREFSYARGFFEEGVPDALSNFGPSAAPRFSGGPAKRAARLLGTAQRDLGKYSFIPY